MLSGVSHMKIMQQRLNELCLLAATDKRPDISRWLLERASEYSSEHSSEYSSAYTCCSCVPTAAQRGDLEVLQWLRSQNCPWDDACRATAEHGHLEILQWLRAQEPPCPWSAATCSRAAGRGHLHILQWLKSLPVLGMS